MDNFNKHLQDSLKDKAFREEFENRELRFKIIDIFIGLRTQYKLSQTEFAKKIGSTQAVVSRIENGTVNVGVDFLQKIANAFDKKIEIKVA